MTYTSGNSLKRTLDTRPHERTQGFPLESLDANTTQTNGGLEGASLLANQPVRFPTVDRLGPL